MDRLDYVSMMCNEHAYCLAIEKLLGRRRADARAVHPRHVRRDHAPPEPPDVARRARPRLRRDEHASSTASASAKTCSTCTRRPRARACTRPTSVRAASTATCPTSMPQYKVSKIRERQGDRAAEREPAGLAARLHRRLQQALPEDGRRVRDPAHRQPHLEAAHRRHRRGHARARAEPRLHRPDAARLGHRSGTCASTSPTTSTTRWTSTCRSASTATRYDRYLVRVEEMRQANRHHPAVRRPGCAPTRAR